MYVMWCIFRSIGVLLDGSFEIFFLFGILFWWEFVDVVSFLWEVFVFFIFIFLMIMLLILFKFLRIFFIINFFCL